MLSLVITFLFLSFFLVITVNTAYTHAAWQCINIKSLHILTTSIAVIYCEDLQTALGLNLAQCAMSCFLAEAASGFPMATSLQQPFPPSPGLLLKLPSRCLSSLPCSSPARSLSCTLISYGSKMLPPVTSAMTTLSHGWLCQQHQCPCSSQGCMAC